MADRFLLGLLLFASLLFAALAAFAQPSPDDPPGRVAHVSQRLGSVVFAPDGENDWVDLPLNRPLTRGDRLWTDRGGRAELHLGSATVHLDAESSLAFYELDEQAAQLSLTQGTLAARVRDLGPRENFEVDTPQLALRALQPGDFRVDVDPQRGLTRVVVRQGAVTLYGERGESMPLAAGQQAAFAGRNLEQVPPFMGRADDFDQWTAERNRLEDVSVSARYLPRHIVGYNQLDAYGSWAQHASYGPVWYPRLADAQWAPYRHGRWAYIRPWGWTWIDDAPWGFAPFHYGRWALIGSRWAWVPGNFGPRPVYAPALVVFLGGDGGAGWSLQVGSGPGIAWYPLAPGEAWFPSYRHSPVYLASVNRNIVIRPQASGAHVHRRHDAGLTAIRVDDFHRSRPVREVWSPLRAAEIGRAPVLQTLPRPERERSSELRDRTPRLQAQPRPTEPLVRESPPRPREREARREDRDDRREPDRIARDPQRPQPEFRREGDAQGERFRGPQERAMRDQQRAQLEQMRQQQDQQRREREQQLEERARDQQRAQQDQLRPQQEPPRRERDPQFDRAARDAQRVQQEQMRAQQERAAAREHERVAREQERAQREQERAQRDQQREQQRAAREQQRGPRERGDDDGGRRGPPGRGN